MKTLLLSLTVLLALAPQAQDKNVAGHYVLQGVMEVGSELLLKPDGTFEYMLAYGAADYWAKGTWQHQGNAVILHTTGEEEEPFRLLRSEAGKPGRERNDHGLQRKKRRFERDENLHDPQGTDAEGVERIQKRLRGFLKTYEQFHDAPRPLEFLSCCLRPGETTR